MVLHVLGISCLDSELHAHPGTHTWLANIYLPLYCTEDSLASAGEENKTSHQLQEKPTLHWERGLWTSTSVSDRKFLQEDRDPESTYSLFSSVANTWLNRDGLEQLHFHWFSVHPGFSIHIENERFLE